MSTKRERVGQRLTDPSLIGDIAEHYAITWLWDEGFQVFKNEGCTGPVDMIGIKNGTVYLFDVKTGRPSSRTPIQKELGVQFIRFNPETRELYFVKHRR